MTTGASGGEITTMGRMWQLARSALTFRHTRSLFAGRRNMRIALLVVVLIAIPFWQLGFFAERQGLSDEYRITKSYGATHQPSLVYFFYNLGLYPISSKGLQTEPSRDGAERLLRENSGRFSIGTAWDRVGVFFLFPHMLFGGDIRDPSFLPANAILLCIALMALFASFWAIRLEVLGLATVAFAGSHPMLLYEVFVHNNLYSLSMTVGLMVLAIHLPFVATHRYFLVAADKPWRRLFLWSAPVATGLLTATFGGARIPAATSIVAVVVILALHQGFPRLQRLSLIGLLCGTFLLTFAGWNTYFDRVTEYSIGFARTRGVENVNPHWRIHQRSPFWHNIWTGIGDYDNKYGYLWEDTTAYALASPELGRELAFHDSTVVYLPRYAAVLRDRIFGDITRDPVWFATIIGKRIWVSVFENTPPRLAVGTRSLDLPFHPVPFALAVAAILGISVISRAWTVVGITLLLLAAGATAILNTSEAGFRYVMLVHEFIYALIPVLGLEIFLALRRRKDRPAAADVAIEPR